MVPQHTILFSGTIRENITYGLKNYTEDQVWAAIDAAFLREVIQKLPDGLDTRVGEQGFKLSGGQRQRLAIARALIRDPRVIILDEATSALDVISEKEVQNAIDNLVRGRTTFIVAHRLSTIRQANKVIVMKEGRAVEVGEPEELMRRNGEFARLKALQA
jgi:ATP-binding cassette subfamily B protein